MDGMMTGNNYESPRVEFIELDVEKGFAVSLLSVTDDGDAW